MPLKTPELTKFTTASQVIASYDFTDIREGTGTIVYFGYTSEDSAAVSYHLSRNALPSATVSTGISVVAVSSIDLDFDTSVFNFAQTVKGTAFLSVGVGAHDTNRLSITAQVKKWDGSTETNISSIITSPDFTGGVGDDATGKNFLLEIPLTQTLIAQGELLRINIILTKEVGGPGQLVELGHDPSDRDGAKIKPTTTTHTSVFKLLVPFELNI